MTSYIIRRLLISLLTLFVISIFAFAVLHIMPGDPVTIALGEGALQEDIVMYRAMLNLDRPLVVQYFLWLKGILKVM